MPTTSAGIVAYRFHHTQLQVLLVHPGGPFFKNKDDGAWSIPKGEYVEGEDPMEVALREFTEETGNVLVPANLLKLSPVKLRSGKWIQAWAVEADFEQPFISSNTFEMVWPPKSGKLQSFPEVDRAGWFTVVEAAVKLNEAQFNMVTELMHLLHKP
jgi:predicted NUDIX family NTP pyrophosphohydrolase